MTHYHDDKNELQRTYEEFCARHGFAQGAEGSVRTSNPSPVIRYDHDNRVIAMIYTRAGMPVATYLFEDQGTRIGVTALLTAPALQEAFAHDGEGLAHQLHLVATTTPRRAVLAPSLKADKGTIQETLDDLLNRHCLCDEKVGGDETLR